MAARPALAIDDTPSFARAIRNATWLLGGKGAGGLLSLAYLALAARGLGLVEFGIFATIQAYSQAFANLVSFQSWQAVVRFGMPHIASHRRTRLARVLRFTATADLAAASVGILAALGGLVWAGPAMGWADDTQRLAGLFLLSLLLAQRGTPLGLLRMAGRFDHAALAEVSLPVFRLIGAVIAYLSEGGVGAFLLAWMLAEAGCSVMVWGAAWLMFRGLPETPEAGLAPRSVLVENPGLLRFLFATNAAASVGLVWQQLPTLAVGLFSGPAGAGIYRLAAQLGTALTKPVTALARALFPELVIAVRGGSPAALRPMLARIVGGTAACGLIALLAVAFAGKAALGLIGGAPYVDAYPVLLLLTTASAVTLAGFGLEPTLVAAGRPWTAFTARSLATGCYLGLIFALVPRFGAEGMGWAAIVGSLLSTLFLHFAFLRVAR